VARLNHPNVVQIYEVGEHDGQPFFSMEYVGGGSLAQRLVSGPMPLAESARLVATLADAVADAHSRGVLHRDLKPANVLLSEGGAPKITDFGLAKRLDLDSGQTPTTAILGTPSYMAPEQAEGKTREVGPAADVWALGAILYELLTGRPPFRGESEIDTLTQVRQREPVAPSRLQPKVPRDLETICLKCLHKEPGKRYATAAELADDLRRYLNGEPIRARRAAWWEVVVKWARRNPGWTGLLAVSAAALVVVVVVWARFTAALSEQVRIAEANFKDMTIERNRAEEGWRQVTKERDLTKEQLERSQKLLYLCAKAVEDNAAAMTQVRAAKEAEGTPAAAFYAMAAVYAETGIHYREDTELKPDDRAKFVAVYESAALGLLKSAEKYDYFQNPAKREKLHSDPRLAKLREQKAFQDWLATLPKLPKPKD
jgi:hypothetical protein